MYKVLITTSGVGSRLGGMTDYTNKSLVRVGKKPALAYIIEQYNRDIPLVITVGNFSKHVIDFCELAYPDRNIEFVPVDKYEGEGSSLAYSLLAAKDKIQCPFIFHAGDTIVQGNIPSPEEYNWVAGYNSEKDSTNYATFVTQGDNITEFLSKGSIDYDYIHVGLVGIKDYISFWNFLEKGYENDSLNSSLNDITSLKLMLENDIELKVINISQWFDIGNLDALSHTRTKISDKFDNLDKVDESILLFDNKFAIKFFANKKNIEGRIKRAKILGDIVPEILDVRDNFYKYTYTKGELLSECINPEIFKELLLWMKEKLLVLIPNVDKGVFKEQCTSFYKTKTLKRIEEFYDKYKFEDKEQIINGKKIPTLASLLNKIDFDTLCDGFASRFHGDFHFENIIYDKGTFSAIDWRQDFAGIHEYGDAYYDLAKLYHGIIVNHAMVRKNNFTIKIGSENIVVDILRPHILVQCEKIFLEFLTKEGYDVHKVKLLTALIYLNIAPLHHNPYDKFLYYLGKSLLYEVLEE